MSTGIGCAYPGCPHPVVGQCNGYRDSCGVFYCAEHSSGKLCWSCAALLREDEERRLEQEAARMIHEDYVRTAKEIRKQAEKTGCLRVALLFVAPAVCVGVGLLGSLLPHSAIGQVWLLAWTFLGAPISVVMAVRGVIRARKRWALNRAVEVSAKKPHFAEFFADWQENRLKEQLMIIAGIAAALVEAGTLEDMGGFGSSSDRGTRQRLDDLHREVDRLRRKL